MTRDAFLRATTSLTANDTTETISSTTNKPVPCLDRIFSFLSRSDLRIALLVSKSWQIEAAKKLWSSFKFVKERDFERIFHVLSRRTNTLQYGDYITSLELVHSDREFFISPNHIFLITLQCPNLLSVGITFHHTRLVAPPGAAHLLINRQHQQQSSPSTAQSPPLSQQNVNNNNPTTPFHSPHQPPPPRPCLPLPIFARQQRQQQLSQQPQQQQQSQQQQQQTSLPPSSPPQQQQPRYSPNLPLVHFAYNCPKLKSLSLVSYAPKTDDSVYEMAKYLTSGSLESIILNNCPTIQSSTLCKLAITNPQLKRVEIMGNTPISDSSLAALVDRCGATLEQLSIGNARQITDKSIRYIALRCKRIRQICIFNNNTERVSEDTLTAIITHCPTLQTISLSDSRCLGSTFFDSVVQRVNIEMASIYRHQAKVGSGLQRLCLGGVKRDMIQSRYMKELIDKSACENDDDTDMDDATNDDEGEHDQLSHILDTTKFRPKSTVIRGNTVWWQRRRILITSST